MLLDVSVGGSYVPVRISKISDTHVVLDDAGQLPPNLAITIGEQTYRPEFVDDELRLPAEFLWYAPRMRNAIIGEGLSAEEWHDPTDFLRRHGADVDPAPFETPQKPRRRR